MELPRYSYHLYSAPVSAAQVNSYLDEQVEFINCLPKYIKNKFKIRTYLGTDFGYNFKDRLIGSCGSVCFDNKKKMISTALNSRVFVSSYNATTFLESFSWNIPTIMFWNPTHWELNNTSISYFNILKEVGILHESPTSASTKVIQIWNDPTIWWNSIEVQKARQIFCNQYSKKIKDLV